MKEESGQKSIDMFLNSSKDMFAGDENFFVCDRFTRQVLAVQKMYPSHKVATPASTASTVLTAPTSSWPVSANTSSHNSKPTSVPLTLHRQAHQTQVKNTQPAPAIQTQPNWTLGRTRQPHQHALLRHWVRRQPHDQKGKQLNFLLLEWQHQVHQPLL